MRRLNVYLIKPSKYDDDGYVIRHLRGILPSNTLACLYALTEEIRVRKGLGEDLEIRTWVLDEMVQKIDIKKIARSGRRKDTRTVVGLVGVQTNQFPRASDLALRFREAGVDVIIGGFHVSGLLAIFNEIPGDIQKLMDHGVSMVAGEVEGHWDRILRDAVEGKLSPLYNLLGNFPDLQHQPVPLVHKSYLRHFVFPNFGTIDCGRGCPFHCTFCTVINVHGRKVRYRSAEVIAGAIRKNYRAGISFYFFTDDNFSRNKNWEAIFDTLIHLRTEEGISVEFMMQVDVLSYKIDRFIEKAKRAGCSNVFIGMESVNAENLKMSGKTQNVVDDYINLVSAWHRAGISTNVGYIIGFPADTLESIKKDIQTLIHRVKVELASFFMLTPLPGSHDHYRMVQEGVDMEKDYNQFDSFHSTVPHANLTNGQWEEAYRYAWEAFYSFENMKTILKRINRRKNYWDMFWKFFWYKAAVTVANGHPMMSGFFRLKDRKDRRPGYPMQSLPAYMIMRVREISREIVGMVRVWWEIQELWLQTRPQTAFEIRLIREWKHLRKGLSSRLTILEWLPSRSVLRISVSRTVQRFNILSSKGIQSRREIDHFWRHVRACFMGGKFHRLHPVKFLIYSLKDFRIWIHFWRSLMAGVRSPREKSSVLKAQRPVSEGSPAVALGIPVQYTSLKRSIESFLKELGIDVIGSDGEIASLRKIDRAIPVPGSVKGYLEGLRGRADFVLLPLVEGLERFHENFMAGLSDMTSDVKGKLAQLPRIIHFPIERAGSQDLRDSLIELGLCFTDDITGIMAASEKADSSA